MRPGTGRRCLRSAVAEWLTQDLNLRPTDPEADTVSGSVGRRFKSWDATYLARNNLE